ncbi:hypothetical protein, partial [Methylobacterium radiotolerans]|uniref:hypothetical protein n=1 Tax=Methylobacterium radiotolerans TaxID=31998 RepID=UPI003D199FF6
AGADLQGVLIVGDGDALLRGQERNVTTGDLMSLTTWAAQDLRVTNVSGYELVGVWIGSHLDLPFGAEQCRGIGKGGRRFLIAPAVLRLALRRSAGL